MKKIYFLLSIIFSLISLNYYAQVYACYNQSPNSPFSLLTSAQSLGSSISDLNLDGNLDIAIINGGLQSVSIYHGNATGSFSLANTYTVNGYPENIAIADLNNDTYNDIITTNASSHNISILYGNITGSFSPSITFSNLVAAPLDIAYGDFDSNGRLDLITANYQTDSITIYDGYPSGNFDSTKTIVKADTNMTGITARDFNNDGKLDLAVCSRTKNRITVLLGIGNGLFSPPSYFNVGISPEDLISLDFNGDSKYDIATANYGGFVSILFGNGTGGFSGLKTFNTQSGTNSINTNDFNSDGKTDILVGNKTSNSVSLLLGNGNNEIISTIHYAVGASPSVNSADFNNDGKIDFIAVNRNTDNVHVFLKRATSQTISGTLSTVTAYPINGKVIIYKYYPSSTSSKLDSLDFMNINSNSYSFTVADSGSYILKAVPSASSLQTTYAQSSTGWKNATVVTHGCFVNSVQNFSVQAFASIGTGSGSMSGVLTQTVGFGQKPNTTMAPYSPSAPGNPIGGIIVKGGKNPGGSYFAQTETDASGTYTLSNLPNTLPDEKLFIFIDMPGLDTTGTYYKTFTSGESYTGLNFLVDSAKIRPTITTSTTPTPTLDVSVAENNFENSLTIFPNPSQDFVKISFNLNTNSNVKIELINILGKSISTFEEEKYLTAKKYVNTYNLKDFSDGAYFIKIHIQNHVLYRKILISR